MGRRAKKPPKLWDNDDLAFAFNSAADFLRYTESLIDLARSGQHNVCCSPD